MTISVYRSDRRLGTYVLAADGRLSWYTTRASHDERLLMSTKIAGTLALHLMGVLDFTRTFWTISSDDGRSMRDRVIVMV
jgi:hypothetical protein